MLKIEDILREDFDWENIEIDEELVKKFRLKRNSICACMLIGYPNINYQRTAPRKDINIEWL